MRNFYRLKMWLRWRSAKIAREEYTRAETKWGFRL